MRALTGRIFSINISEGKGVPKRMVMSAVLKEDHGFEGDAHAGPGIRQVSLLAVEDIERAEAASKSPALDFQPGIFAENITTEYLDLSRLRVGDKLKLAGEAVLRITQIGKECHGRCAVAEKAGSCIMPKLGLFAVVEKGAEIRVHDPIEVVSSRHRMFSWSKT